MKQVLLLTAVSMLITVSAYAENSILNYGYYESSGEVSAKDELINAGVEEIFDFETSANPKGESIQDGKYYVPIRYQGGYPSVDEDYIYVEELMKTDPQVQENKEWNETQDTQINQLFLQNINSLSTSAENKAQIQKNTQRINDLESLVSGLEETQYIIGGEVRLQDSKKWTTKAFADFSTNRNQFDRVGVRFTFKMGESHEEKRINELERKLQKLIEER